MKTRGMKIRTVMAALALVCFAAAGAQAQVQLRFDPPDTTVAVGQPCRMSIVLDDTLRIRTIDVTVDYDTTVVRSLGGGAGTLYTSSGVFTFQGFEEDVPGQWHGYAVLMGAGLYIQGPGELYYWEFEGLIDGRSPVTTVSVYLSTTDGSWFESVELPGAQVTVGAGPTSSVDDLPGVRTRARLWPNPFNPRTEVHAELARAGRVNVSVYDLRGRRLAVLQDGWAEPGALRAAWDGSLPDGSDAPGGTYLFRVQGPDLDTTVKGLLVK